ncbi:tetratricopeptide repeat protein [Candidatus Poribacteria bacterium]|nr:tetratricopeptide repeat protein [Candidatus Poribacteria bacterium]
MKRLILVAIRAFAVFFVAVSAAVSLADEAPAPEAPKRPTELIEAANCVTSECHSEVEKYAITHGPVAVRTCDACHQLTSAINHTFEPTREKAELCTYCHEFDTGFLPVVHKPVLAGECLGCHNPHGGTDHKLLREATLSDTCGRCHESVAYGSEFLHPPVENGECTNCHRPHAAKYPMLLDETGTELCNSCHKDFARQVGNAQFTHKALEKGCGVCHDAHGTGNPLEITKALPGLCLDCHEEIRESTESPHQHPAALGERACLTCHTPHGGNLASLMRGIPLDVCMCCHDKELETTSGGKVIAMTDIGDPAKIKHSPIRDGQCGGCHTIHGGDTPLLLSETYSPGLHQNAAGDTYELCFCCHDESFVGSEEAGGLTQFRNGSLNLHWVHVMSREEFGHNCRVCHGVHSATQPSLVRDWVQYGDWKMPVRFTMTATGGTCMTGCHHEYSYDRVNPVPSKTALLASEKTIRVPAADRGKPVNARFWAWDTTGAAVEVPDKARPTVLLFVRADQTQSREVVKLVTAAMPQIEGAKVIILFCGDQAGEHARVFAASESNCWTVTSDPGLEIAGPLGVQVWPATLVVKSDGVVVAHLGGVPPLLTTEVRAYLDLATGRIGREALTGRLAEYGLVGDDPARRASWHLQMGRKLLRRGDAAKARTMLEDGLKFAPESVDLRVALVRALVESRDGAKAMDLLKSLPPGALDSGDGELLRGRALALTGRWDEARRIAVGLLKDSPDLAEAHYLMGLVYEHDREWELAAQEYRAAAGNPR